MKKANRLISLLLSAALCVGMTSAVIPAAAITVSAAEAADPLANVAAGDYTRVDLSSTDKWNMNVVNNITPQHEFTIYNNVNCIKLTYSDVGAQWRWYTATNTANHYMVPPSFKASLRVDPQHKYVVATYATDNTAPEDLYLYDFGTVKGGMLLDNDVSRSDGYWIATNPVEVTQAFYDRANAGKYWMIFMTGTDTDEELYIRDLVFFKNLEDAKAYTKAIPAALNNGYDPTTVVKQYKEVTVNSMDFEGLKDASSLMIKSSVETNVKLMDDAKYTNLRDPKSREIAGIPSIESDANGSYLRVSKRIANYAALNIPLASANMIEKAGTGKYVLTFDMKAITTKTLLFNQMVQNYNQATDPADGRLCFYESSFLSDKIGFRYALTVGNKNFGYIHGMAPGDIQSVQNLGITHETFSKESHPIPSLDEWHTFRYEFDVENPGAVTLSISGANWPLRNVDYAIDNVKLTAVVEVKENGGSTGSGTTEPTGPATDVSSEGYKIEGLMLNLDDSRFSEPNKANAAFLTEEDAIVYIDQYIGSHITDLVLTVNTSFMSMFPSEVWDDQLDEYANGKGAQSAVWYRYESLGIDPWALWVDRLWENDVNPWLSFRMNDTHASDINSILSGDTMWAHYEEYKRVKHRDDLIYRGDRCFDFTIKEVRDSWLAYIEEAVNKYDIYGIELDWLRDPVFTAIGSEFNDMDLLTQFHRDIRAIVDKAALKWGHDIKIGMRCARDIQTNIEAGFDIVTMCAEGVLDVVIPSAYYITDTEIPVLTWKKILQSYDVEVYPNVTQGVLSVAEGDRSTSNIAYYTHIINSVSDNIEVMAGTAASYFAQGADKLYIFNVFGDSAKPITAEQKVETDLITPLSNNLVRWKMQTTIGSYAKVQAMTRRYLLTFQDYAGYFGTSDTQLPIEVKKPEKYSYFNFITGDIKDNDTVTLVLGIDSTTDYSSAMKIFVNGKRATFLGRTKSTSALCKDAYLYSFKVDASVLDNSAVVEITTTDENKPYTVTYAELVVGATSSTAALGVNAALANFTDISPTASYYDAVAYVVDKGLFNGTSNTTFEPNTPVNRAMFVTVLGRLEGINPQNYTKVSFNDVVANSWYSSYVEWASSKGVVNGLGNGVFGVLENLTVEQACVMLSRYADSQNGAISTGISTANFRDAGSVSSWATSGVNWALANGIYEGTGSFLNPASPASRALVATMFYNYVTAFKK